MKTSAIIVTVLLAFQSTLLSASVFRPVAPMERASSESVVKYFAPAIPLEATFEDASVAIENMYNNMAPVVPATADFDDLDALSVPVLNLAPVLPKEADFEDAVTTDDYRYLAPVVPLVADFE